MFTYNVFVKKKCFFNNDAIVIGGDSYAIKVLKEDKKTRERINKGIIYLALFSLIIFYQVFLAISEEIIGNPNMVDKIIKSVTLSAGMGLFGLLWYFVLSIRTVRSVWMINDNKSFFVEPDDDNSLESRLRRLEEKIAHTPQISTMKDSDRGLYIALSVLGIGFLCVVAGLNKIGPILLVIGALLNIWVMIDTVRWKK